MNRTRLGVVLTTMVALHLLVAGWFALHRPIDGDEGYYGLAARLVSEGQYLYSDFFYPQAPLLPHAYAPAARLIGAPQLPGLRLVSVALGGLAMALLAVWVARAHGRRPRVAMAALAMIALSPEVITWSTVVKTYAFTDLSTAAALLCGALALGDGRRAWLWALLGGAAMGLASSTRLLLAPAAVAPAIWWLMARGHRRPRTALFWLLGVSLGALPLVMAWLADADRFWFNNVGYHRLRFSVLEDAPFWQRGAAALKTLSLALLGNPGLLLMLAAVGWGWRDRLLRRTKVDPAADLGLVMAGAYSVGCLLPDPVYVQYFTGVLPILLWPAAAHGLAALPWPDGRTAVTTLAAAAGVLVLSLGVIRHDLTDEPAWTLDHYRQVCRRIEQGTSPGDTVFAFWSGYVAGSGRRPSPGMENHFAVGVSERLNQPERRRYHIVGRRELARTFRRQDADLVVVGAWMNEIDTALDNEQMERLLGDFTTHYYFVAEIDGVKLCVPVTGNP